MRKVGYGRGGESLVDEIITSMGNYKWWETLEC